MIFRSIHQINSYKTVFKNSSNIIQLSSCEHFVQKRLTSEQKDKTHLSTDNNSSKSSLPEYIKRVSTFQKCTQFQNSLFDTREISVMGMPNYIDNKAEMLETKFRQEHPNIEKRKDPLHRLSCYLAATEPARFFNKSLLYKTNLTTYFPKIPFVQNQNHTKLAKTPQFKKHKAKIAYLYMVHGDSNEIDRVLEVLHIIRDQDAFVLIHVDKRSNVLHNKLATSISKYPNVRLTENRLQVDWGRSSMVYVQLAGFFELLDLAEWDFVINLSSHDYPTRNTSYIHKQLEKDHIYITHWYDQLTYLQRTRSALFANAQYNNWVWFDKRRKFPFEYMQRRKQHQWMILPRSYVHYLRTEDQDAHDVLTYMESSEFADEWFFITTILKTGHPFKDKVINNNKRYISPFHGPHPKDISSSDIPKSKSLLDKKEFYFLRKIDVLEEKEVIAWLDDERRKH